MSKQLKSIQILLKQHKIIYKLLFMKELLKVIVEGIHLSKSLRTIKMQQWDEFYLLYSEGKCSWDTQHYAWPPIHGKTDFHKDFWVLPNSHIRWSCDLTHLSFVSGFSYIIFNFFSVLSLSLCRFYSLYLNCPTPIFLWIGNFQMRKTGKQSLFWELFFTGLRRQKLSCLPAIYLCATKFCAWNKGLGHVYILMQYFLVAVNTAYHDTIVSSRVEVNKSDT